MTSRVGAFAQSRLLIDLQRWARPARDGAILAGAAFALLIAAGKLPFAVDAHAYWASDPFHPYSAAALSDFDGYFYSPAFTQVLGPLHALPWPIFAGLWTFMLVLVLAGVTGPLLALVILLPPVFMELAVGNIHVLIGAAIAIGFRWPAAWAFILLTKVTPGICLLWFAVRREWRHLAIALVATAVIFGVSFAIAPGAWFGWFDVLVSRSGAPGPDLGLYNVVPLVVRMPIAIVLVVWGARTDRPWVVPIAAILALPVIWPNATAIAIALVPILMGWSYRSRQLAPSDSVPRAS